MSDSELLTWAPGRVFVSLAIRGCGSGCKYCYISAPGGRQEPRSVQTVASLIESLRRDPRFMLGRGGTILTLGPDTEPLKTQQSIDLMGALLSSLLPLGNPIQVSTKEVLPLQIRDVLRGTDPAQVVVFTSFTTFAHAAQLEPGAAEPRQRLGNFRRVEGFKSCALFKPFLPQTAREAETLVEMLTAVTPDAACIGISYRQRPTGLDHPVEAGWRSPGITEAMRSFRRLLLEQLGIPVFYSSTCVNAFFLDRPAPAVRELTPFLCVDCGRCPADL